MGEDFLKEMVAKLLVDARRIQLLEPNAGTQKRIEEAEKKLSLDYSLTRGGDVRTLKM